MLARMRRKYFVIMRQTRANAGVKSVLVIIVNSRGGNVMKKIIGLVAISTFLWIGPFAWSEDTKPAEAIQVVDAGNKICPVSRDKVTGKHFVEHNGKRYGLCCPMCANKFKKNPEKYLKQMASGSTVKNHSHHH